MTELMTADGFSVGQSGRFKGIVAGPDQQGAITICGRIKRLEIANAELFGVIQCDEAVDKHRGIIRYEGMDVVRRLQLTGNLVDVLHGRPVRHASVA